MSSIPSKRHKADAPTTRNEAGLLKNDHGLEYVKLVHPETGATADVYLFGGVVTSYVDKVGGIEFIGMRSDAVMDGSKPISGGLAHCWPQFGPGKIQQHGFARNATWEVKDISDTSVTLELAPSEYTQKIWDYQFLLKFTVSLEVDRLATKLIAQNKELHKSFDFSAALHSYFAVSLLENLEIQGSFQGREFLNRLVNDGKGEVQTEDRSVITISEAYDRVYKGVNDPVLKDKGTGRTLEITNDRAWPDTMIWNPYGNEKQGYRNFVCAESVLYDPITLDAGATWTANMALKPGSI